MVVCTGFEPALPPSKGDVLTHRSEYPLDEQTEVSCFDYTKDEYLYKKYQLVNITEMTFTL